MLNFIKKQFRGKDGKDTLADKVAKGEVISPFTALNNTLGGILGNFDNKDTIYQLYESNEIFRLGVDRLANDLSTLNYAIVGEDKTKDKEMEKLLLTINSREFKTMMNDCWKDYILDGNMIQTKYTTKLKELYFNRIAVKNNNLKAYLTDGQITSIELTLDTTEMTDKYGMNERLFIFGNRDPRLSQLSFISPISAVLDELRRVKTARDWNNQLLARGGITPVLLTMKEGATVNAQQLKENLALLDKAQSANKGSPIGFVPIENVEIHIIGSSAKDMDFVGGQKQAVNNILLGMGIPPEILGLNDMQAAKATKLDAMQGYYNSTIIPLAERYGGMLSLWLNKYGKQKVAKTGDKKPIDGRYERLFTKDISLMVDKSSVPYAQDLMAKRMNDLEKITFLTNNEKREQFGLEPLEGMDTPPTNNDNTEEENGDE